MPRLMDVVTPLGADTLLFHSMRATETLGLLFDYQLTLLSTRNDLAPDGGEAGGGDSPSTVSVDGKQIALDAKTIHLTGKEEIVLSVGATSIKLKADQIEISSPLVKINV